MAQNDYCDFLRLPTRPKPREEGLTSFHDRFLPIKEVEIFLEVASEAMDYAKLIHIGLYPSLPKGWLRKKLRLYKDNGVKTYPGGVPFQVAVVQNKVPDYFNWLRDQGFDAVEIAEDAMSSNMEIRKWDEIIKMALDKGLEVITELGKKDPEKPLDLGEAYESIQHDLTLGVSHVTIERSELNPYLKGDSAPFVDLVQKVGLKHLIFEPNPFGWPHIHQWCFKTFGPKVNMGNIMKDELMAIEWARRGLQRLSNYAYFK